MSDNIENKTDDKKVGLRLHKPITKYYDANEIREWFYNGTRKSKEMKVSDEAVRIINEMISDPEFDGHRLKETMQQYQDALLNKQTVNLEHYANAIRFCSYLETNGGNATQAYIKTFKHRDFVKKALKAIEDDPDKGYESQDYMNIHAAALPITARIDLSISLSSSIRNEPSTTPKYVVNQTNIVERRIIVPAFLMKDRPRSHVERRTFLTVGQ